MTKDLWLAAGLIAVGLSMAGAGTHLYQMLSKQQAALRYDGKNFMSAMGNLAVSFLCGPYIMLQMGWQHEDDGTISMTSALVSALVAFGWAFVTGLMVAGAYVAIFY